MNNKPMIIVVEGPDNAGKTTLALKIAKALRAVFVKAERPAAGPDLLVYQTIIETACNYSGIVVTDRHVALSEPIYGTVCRGGHQLQGEDIQYCLERIGMYIYCRPPAATILRTLKERPQMEGVVENARAIIDAYDMYFELMHTDQRHLLKTYNFETTPDSEVIDFCRRVQQDHFIHKGTNA